MFNNLGKKSDKYHKLYKEVSEGGDLCKRISQVFTLREGNRQAASLDISYFEFASLSTYAKSVLEKRNSPNYTVNIKNVDNRERVEINNELFTHFENLLAAGDKITKEDPASFIIEGVASMLKFGSTGVEAAPVSSALPKAYRPKTDLVVALASRLTENKIDSYDGAVTQMKEAYMKDGGSTSSIAQVYFSAAPDKAGLGEIIVPDVVQPGFIPTRAKPVTTLPQIQDIDTAAKSYEIIANNTHSNSGPTSQFYRRHIYGIPFRNDFWFIIHFLAEFSAPTECDTIHLYSKDIKYAIGLRNKYPKKQIVMRGSAVSSGSISCMPSSEMAKLTRDNIVAVNPKAQKFGRVDKKSSIMETSIEKDKVKRARLSNYKYYFRYVSPYAMRPNVNYSMSNNCMDGLVRECSYMAGEDRLTVMNKMLYAAIHRHMYLWIHRPLNKLVNWFPSLAGTYDFSIAKATDDAREFLSVLQFIDGTDDTAYKDLCETTLKSMVATATNNNNAKPASVAVYTIRADVNSKPRIEDDGYDDILVNDSDEDRDSDHEGGSD